MIRRVLHPWRVGGLWRPLAHTTLDLPIAFVVFVPTLILTALIVEAVGEDRILFETDFPYPTCLCEGQLVPGPDDVRSSGRGARGAVLVYDSCDLVLDYPGIAQRVL